MDGTRRRPRGEQENVGNRRAAPCRICVWSPWWPDWGFSTSLLLLRGGVACPRLGVSRPCGSSHVHAKAVTTVPGEPSAGALHIRMGLRRKGGSSCHLIDRPPHPRGFPGTTAGIGGDPPPTRGPGVPTLGGRARRSALRRGGMPSTRREAVREFNRVLSRARQEAGYSG